MIKIRFFNIQFLIFISFLLSCNTSKPLQVKEIDETLTVQEITTDIDYLYQKITTVNPLFYDDQEKQLAFKNSLDHVKHSLDKPLKRTDLFITLAPLVSELDDGHTNLSLPMDDIYNFLDKGGLLFPMDVLFVDGKIYIERLYSDGYRINRGLEILSINGVTANQILSDLTAIQSGANHQWRLRRMEGQSDIFKALLWMKYGWSEEFELELLHNQDPMNQTVKGIPIDLIREQRAESNVQSPYEYKLLEEQVGLLTIRYFGSNFKEFRNFLRETFELIEKDGISNLIIDVRDNPGGQTDRSDELLSYLVSEPFYTNSSVFVRSSKLFKTQAKQRIPKIVRWLPLQYFDSRGRAIWRAEEGDLVFISEKKVQPKNKSKRYMESVYLLINEGSFSTSAVFSSVFKEKNIGMLIGRPTGGEGGTFFAEPLRTYLPYSNLAVNISTMKFALDENSDGKTLPGIEPDIFVKKTIEDELKEIDTILEEAKSIIYKN